MATTYTGSQAAAAVQPRKNDFAGVVQSSIGSYTTTAAFVINDLFNMSKLPAGCLAIGGEIQLAGALETGTGSATLDIDVGWSDNGAASATLTDSMGVTWTNMGAGAASAAGFVDSGVFNMAVVANVVAAGFGWRPYNMSGGPVYFSAETTVQAKCIAIANAYAAGIIYTRTDFIVVG